MATTTVSAPTLAHSTRPLQPLYPAFPTALHHDPSTYDASGYEPHEPHLHAQHRVDSMHDSNSVPAVQFDMLPPLASTHASWQALHDHAQLHASKHGYALSINTTARNRSRIKLACVCFGQPKNTHKLTAETRIRKNRISYKTGCKMWIEGKKQEDGKWFLRVGEPQHNHPGRPSEGWAVQRKRTWGVVGGRIGVGGVTAQEEARLGSISKAQADKDNGEDNQGDEGQEHELLALRKPNHSLDRGGVVWEIVEQEMWRKGEPNQGLDRGVGRTVQVLKARLPGIHIFKRDVYNIRAQIKKARKVADQRLDPGTNSDQEKDVHDADTVLSKSPILQSNDQQQPLPPAVNTHQDESATIEFMPMQQLVFTSSKDVEQVRKENAHLKAMLSENSKEIARLNVMLSEKTKETVEKDMENAALRTQLEYMTSMPMLPG